MPFCKFTVWQCKQCRVLATTAKEDLVHRVHVPLPSYLIQYAIEDLLYRCHPAVRVLQYTTMRTSLRPKEPREPFVRTARTQSVTHTGSIDIANVLRAYLLDCRLRSGLALRSQPDVRRGDRDDVLLAASIRDQIALKEGMVPRRAEKVGNVCL